MIEVVNVNDSHNTDLLLMLELLEGKALFRSQRIIPTLQKLSSGHPKIDLAHHSPAPEALLSP
jgi:hypothetical protein